MMATAYDLLGIEPDATRAELDTAYASKRAAYDPTRVAGLGDEFVQLALQRRAELTAAYQSLRPALTAPPRLTPEAARRRERQTIWALLVFIALALVVLLLRGVAVPDRSVVAVGAEESTLKAEYAPDFMLPTLDGSRRSLSDYRGQVVLINVWATWCPSCVRETPRLQRLYEQYRKEGFVLLGINTTFQDQRKDIETFVRDHGLTFPVLLDETGDVGDTYGARLIPTSYLIDRDGRIVYTKVGEIDEAQLKEQIAALLKTGE